MSTLRHPHAVQIDPDEGKPPLMGSRWRRREPAGDAYDLVDVVGVFDMGEMGFELCVRTVAFEGDPVVTADGDSFVEAYTRLDHDDIGERVGERLRELQARLG